MGVLDTGVLETEVLRNNNVINISEQIDDIEQNEEPIVSKDDIGKGNLFIVLGTQYNLHNKYVFENGNTNWDLVHSGFLLLDYKIGNPSTPKKITLKQWIDNYMKKHSLTYLSNIVIYWHGVDGIISMGQDYTGKVLTLEASDITDYINRRQEMIKKKRKAIETLSYLGEKLANPKGSLYKQNLFFMNCELGQGNFSKELRKLYFSSKKLSNFNIILNEDYTSVYKNKKIKQWVMNWERGLAEKRNFNHPQFRVVNKNENKILKYKTTTTRYNWFNVPYEVEEICYHNLSIHRTGTPLRPIYECFPLTD